MGIASGSVSYLRFVAGPVPDGFEALYAEALAQHRFSEIDPRSEEERRVGWVRFDDPFEGDFDPLSLVSESGHIFLKLRIDTLKIPGPTLKVYVDQAAKQRAATLGRDKLVRKEIDALKLEIKKSLRVRSLPRLQLLEIVWNVQTGEVRLMATSRALADTFLELFEKTFSQSLRPVGLLTVLWLRGLSEAEVDGLAALEAERFHLVAQ
jgi:recombination associated protein RdgC